MRVKGKNEVAILFLGFREKITGLSFVTLVLLMTWLAHAPLVGLVTVMIWIFLNSTQTFSIPTSFTLAVLLPLVSFSLITTWSYAVSLSFIWLEFSALILISCAVAFFHKNTELKFSREAIPSLAALLPSICTLLVLLNSGHLNGKNLGWMLSGDAQNNTVAIREIILHNGADPAQNSAPALVQLVMSSMAAHATEGLPPREFFLSIVQSDALVLAFLWSLVSISFGFIALREFVNFSISVRVIASFFGAVFPLSWFVLGFSLQAGFYNAPGALLAVSLSWIIWREQELLSIKSQYFVASVLGVSTIFTLMAWVPLAIIPSSMLAIVLWRIFIFDKNLQIFRSSIFWGSMFLLVLYVLAIVVPSYLGHSDALTSDGWMTELGIYSVATIWLLAVITAALLSVTKGGRGTPYGGLSVYAISMVAASAFLIIPGLANGSFWGYYPRKFVWFSICILMFLVAVIVVSVAVKLLIDSWLSRYVAVIGTLALLGLGMLSVPFAQTGILRPFPFLQIVFGAENTENVVDAVADSVGKKVIRLQYDQNDFISNQWAFQWASKHDGKDNLWSYAYSQIKNPKDVCSAAKDWGGNVTLLSKSYEIRSQVRELCGELILDMK